MGLIVALLMLSTIWVPQSGISEDSRDGETILNVVIRDDLMGYNPLVLNDVWSWKVIGWVFDGLVWRNITNNEHIEPWAAEWFHHGPESTWDTSVGYPDYDNNTDYRNWTLKLRDGIKWHDWQSQSGDDRYVRAHDVIFSLRLMADVPRYAGRIDCLVARNPNGSIMYGRDLPENGTIRLISWDGENVTQLPIWMNLSSQRQYPNLPVVYVWADSDDLTLHYYLTYDFVDFSWRTLSLPTFPERIWKDHVDEKLTWNSPSCLINFGPFMFDKWNFTNESGMIRTFRNYFHVEYDEFGRAKPYIDGIRFKTMRSTDVAIQMLQSGEADYIAWSIDPSYIDTIQQDRHLTLVRGADMGFRYIGFNMRMPDFGYAGYDPHDVDNGVPKYDGNYTDIGKPFRIAMAHLADKQTMVQTYLHGFGTVGASVVSPINNFWYNPNIRIYGYNETKAVEILDSYAPDTDGNGIRELPFIGEDEIRLLFPAQDYDPPCTHEGMLFESIAQSVGIHLVYAPTFESEIMERVENHDFQMYISDWHASDPIFSLETPYYMFSSYNDGKGYNYVGYHNRSFDRLCMQFMREGNVNARRNLAYRMQETIAEDVPAIVLYYRDDLYAYSNRLVHFGFDRYSIMNTMISDCTPNSPIKLSISIPSNMVSGESYDIRVYAYDASTSSPIDEMNVSLTVSSGSLSSEYATTDSYGIASVKYTAPEVDENTTVYIEVQGTYKGAATCSETKAVVMPYMPSSDGVGIKIEMNPRGVIFVNKIFEGENFTVPITIRVRNTSTMELLGEYNNSTGNGVVLNISVVPQDAKANMSISYKNRTWTLYFHGNSSRNCSLYHIDIGATSYLMHIPVSSDNDYIAIAIKEGTIGPPPKHTPYENEGNSSNGTNESNENGTSNGTTQSSESSWLSQPYVVYGIPATIIVIAAIAIILIFRRRAKDF